MFSPFSSSFFHNIANEAVCHGYPFFVIPLLEHSWQGSLQKWRSVELSDSLAEIKTFSHGPNGQDSKCLLHSFNMEIHICLIEW